MRGEERREKTLGTQWHLVAEATQCGQGKKGDVGATLPGQCQASAMAMMMAQNEVVEPQVQPSLGVCRRGPEPTYKMRPMALLISQATCLS